MISRGLATERWVGAGEGLVRAGEGLVGAEGAHCSRLFTAAAHAVAMGGGWPGGGARALPTARAL